MLHIKAPTKLNETNELKSVPSCFLAGAIDMGKAVNWQDYVADKLQDLNCIVYNPRRDDWDSSWEQSRTNKLFSEQVSWEQKMLHKADVAFFAFPKDSKAPITLLELGISLEQKSKNKVIVFCEPGYYRKGNIDIVCTDFYDLFVYEDLNDAISRLKYVLKQLDF